jgi:hypothetical protein
LTPAARLANLRGVNTPSLRRFFAVAAAAAVLAGCKSSTSDIVPLGGNLYAVTRESTNIINRNDKKLKEQAEDDAARFCEMRGKQLQVVDVTADKPNFRDGFVSVKLTFRAVDAAAVAPAPSMGSAEVAPPGSSEFYRKLKELEDLRKSGVITEDEFETAKKKILDNDVH